MFVTSWIYVLVAVSLFRFKFYFIWYLTEAACIAAGLGYNGETAQGKVLWDAVNNAGVLECEFAVTVAQMTNNWNKGINFWLKNCAWRI